MLQYTTRRLLSAIPVLIGIVVVVFFLSRSIPGDPCKAMLGEKATIETCERFAEINGLNEPLPVQFALFMGKILRGDLGESIRFSRPVALFLAERLPTTIELAFASLTLAVVIGTALGIISALRHNSPTDVATMVGANIGVSMPVFWLGLMLAYLFAIVFKDTFLALPPSGRISPGLSPTPFYEVYGIGVTEGTPLFLALEFIANLYIFNSLITLNFEVLGDVLKHLILPATALATIPLAIIARMTRSSLLDVMGREYIRAARAKGLKERMVVIRHGLRNALLPLVTIIGLSLGLLLNGAVLTETVFGFAGVGRMLFEAITARDFPIIQGFTLIVAVNYVLLNLLVDLSYGRLDPRVQLGTSE